MTLVRNQLLTPPPPGLISDPQGALFVFNRGVGVG